MKRRLLKLGLLLLLGAIVNVAVAWTWVLPISKPSGFVPRSPTDEEQAIWVEERPEGFHQALGTVEQGANVGAQFKFLFGDMNGDLRPDTVDFGISIYDNRKLELATHVATGWPAKSLSGSTWTTVSQSTSPSETNRYCFHGPSWFKGLFPIGWIWPGFAVNTTFYAALVWLLFFVPLQLRRWRRIRRGLCPACAYPVGTSDKCTECGKPVTPRSVERGP